MFHVERFYYPEHIAPFGELDIVVPKAVEKDVAMTGANIYTRSVRDITYHAWLKSSWLPKELSDEQVADMQTRPPELLPFVHLSAAAARYAVTAGQAEQRVAFAVKPNPQKFVGYSHAKVDVSGSVAEQAFKRAFRRDKVYGTIVNANVLPAYQKQKIGAALMDASLWGLPHEITTSTYTAAANTDMITKLGELGYIVQGEPHERDDLFGIAYSTTKEVRLVGPSVGNVLDRLHDTYPWIDKAIITV